LCYKNNGKFAFVDDLDEIQKLNAEDMTSNVHDAAWRKPEDVIS
jgi:hypothetical protein